MANHFVSDKRRDEVAGASAPQVKQASNNIAATHTEAEYKNGSAQTAAHQTLHRSIPGAIPSIDASSQKNSVNSVNAAAADVATAAAATAADAAAAEEARLSSLQGFTTAFAPISADEAQQRAAQQRAQQNTAQQYAQQAQQAQRAARTPGHAAHGAVPDAGAQPAQSAQPATPQSAKPVISLRNVSKVYPAQPDKPALQNVSLDVYPGEFVFVVGHSGSGKSTFLRMLTRELKATSGKVIVAGQDLTSMRNWKVPYLRRQIGCVFQDFKLLPGKTTYENVAFALECIGKPKSVIKVQVPEVLRLVGLGEKMDSYPDQLSGGEQQRVSVARAMVNRPPLLICDEPTGNLDPAISLGIMKLLERINRTGTTVLMATHDREMVDSMRKRVIALEAGKVVRDQERGGYGYYGAL